MFQRSAAAPGTDSDTTTPPDCPTKGRANKKEKYSLEAYKKINTIFKKKKKNAHPQAYSRENPEKGHEDSPLARQLSTTEGYRLGIGRADVILAQQSISNAQLWSLKHNDTRTYHITHKQ